MVAFRSEDPPGQPRCLAERTRHPREAAGCATGYTRCCPAPIYFHGRTAMSEMVAVAFDNPTQADEVLDELRRLQQEYLIDLEDAVVAVRRPDGEVKLKQSVSLA